MKRRVMPENDNRARTNSTSKHGGENRNGNRNPYYQGPPSDHFDGEVFFNPGGAPPGKLSRILRWRFMEKRPKWPSHAPSPFPPAEPEERLRPDALRVTHVGHATMLIQTGALNILTDPVWSERVSPLRFAGPKRVNAPGICFEALPPIDLVLVSHNHYDHLDISTLERLKTAHDPLVVTPLGNDTIIKRSVPHMRIAIGDWGDSVIVRETLQIHFEPVHHWSARGLNDRRMALWSGFVIEGPAGKIYHVGDTGFHGGRNYRDAAKKHGGFRLAILPFGAYEPRWFMKNQHQNPQEAVAGMGLCNAAHVAGHHWGTFHLTDEAIEAPKQELHAALDEKNLSRDRFKPMHPGEVWDVPE
jgi:L-ascorbate metabolism protein UlaG (beta-lactamase superfamily)